SLFPPAQALFSSCSYSKIQWLIVVERGLFPLQAPGCQTCPENESQGRSTAPKEYAKDDAAKPEPRWSQFPIYRQLEVIAYLVENQCETDTLNQPEKRSTECSHKDPRHIFSQGSVACREPAISRKASPLSQATVIPEAHHAQLSSPEMCGKS